MQRTRVSALPSLSALRDKGEWTPLTIGVIEVDVFEHLPEGAVGTVW